MFVVYTYKITLNLDETKFYVGSTRRTPRRRFLQHIKACNDLANNSLLYTLMREHGHANFTLVTLETRLCPDNISQLMFEREMFDRLNPTLNMIRPYVTEEEKRQHARDYYYINQEDINIRRKERIPCECGKSYSWNHKARHQSTDRHYRGLRGGVAAQLLQDIA